MTIGRLNLRSPGVFIPVAVAKITPQTAAGMCAGDDQPDRPLVIVDADGWLVTSSSDELMADAVFTTTGLRPEE